jgi:hypothetical protein
MITGSLAALARKIKRITERKSNMVCSFQKAARRYDASQAR